ncbi:MAG TPA: hypothetical protein VED46_02480 [Alphaproteobacteria bacterium]|nr:hypothetical protein [Alphaproteobacteria bacterium]
MLRVPPLPRMAIALAAGVIGCTSEPRIDADLATHELRTLTGAEIQQILTSNTLVGEDGQGSFWMHYPSLNTVWGLASDGDVDIGRWWVSGNHYCRAWRHWSGGTEQCWLLASNGSSRLVWIEPNGRYSGDSTIQAGNSIGLLTNPQIASALIGSDVTLAGSSAPFGNEVPVDATGRILVAGNSSDRGQRDLGAGDSQSSGGEGASGGSGGGAQGDSGSGGGSSGSGSPGSGSPGSGSSGAGGGPGTQGNNGNGPGGSSGSGSKSSNDNRDRDDGGDD